MSKRFVFVLVLFVVLCQSSVSAEAPAGPIGGHMGPPVVGDWAPEISTSPRDLHFATAQGYSWPDHYPLQVRNSGRSTLHWYASTTDDWLLADPTVGDDGDTISVGVNPVGLMAGTYQGAINLSAWNATNSPLSVPVSLTVYDPEDDQPPFGSFSTPVSGAVESGIVPVTGWVLDDIEVESVGIYRAPEGDSGPPVYIGDATQVEGARPDVAQAYPGHPANTKAGWGYMLVTNSLPNGGNGTYTFYAIASDSAGQETTLGTKTIVCDNANAIKPFGAIDAPMQGGTASGSSFANTGWALSPQADLAADGASVIVRIDGQTVGQASYGTHREDIATGLPGYANSEGAGAVFEVDTTAYRNGVHTIEWTATDSAGNRDGIGSRFFKIDNDDYQAPTGPEIQVSRSTLQFKASPGNAPPSQTFWVRNTGAGHLECTVSSDGDWMFCTPDVHSGGAVQVMVDPLDTVGTHRATITVRDQDPSVNPATVDVVVDVDTTADQNPPFGAFDTPACGSNVASSIPVTGWALDDSGVDHVKIYRRADSGALHYIGDAAFVEGARPDVALHYPNYPNHTGAGWGYTIQSQTLPGGTGSGLYTLVAVASDSAGNRTTLGTKTIWVDNEHAVKPFGAIDTPAQGGVASGSSYVNRGWVLTPQPNRIPTGNSAIGVWVDDQYLGSATYGAHREDIATLFPGHANSDGAGAMFYLDTTAYENGVHTIHWTARDDAGNTDGIGSRFFSIQNPSSGSVGGSMMATATNAVTNTAHYATIQDAIRGVAKGGTITIAAGTYEESVTLDKNLHVILEGDVRLNGDLDIEAGTWVCPEGTFTLAGDLTHMAGGFDPNDGTVAFTAGMTHSILGPTLFHNLTVGEDAVVETATPVLIEGALINNGTLRESQPIYGTGAVTFGLVDAVIEPTTAGLDRLIIERVDQNHPNATGNFATGRYWRMTPDGDGYVVNLTLPHVETPTADDGICRYGGSGDVWDCGGVQTFDEQAKTITREGLDTLGDFVTRNDAPAGYVVLPLVRK